MSGPWKYYLTLNRPVPPKRLATACINHTTLWEGKGTHKQGLKSRPQDKVTKIQKFFSRGTQKCVVSGFPGSKQEQTKKKLFSLEHNVLNNGWMSFTWRYTTLNKLAQTYRSTRNTTSLGQFFFFFFLSMSPEELCTDQILHTPFNSQTQLKRIKQSQGRETQQGSKVRPSEKRGRGLDFKIEKERTDNIGT